MEPHDAIHLSRNAFIVGRDQGGRALPAHKRDKLGENDVGGMLVEVAGRLVGTDQRRLVG
jgi:hypothetical protein